MLGVIACVLAPGGAALAQEAQDYPSRPIRIITGSAPGGVSDIPARHLARHLEKALKQTVIVENRPGAGTSLAARAVSQSAPDGYTLFYGNPSIFGPALMAGAVDAETQMTPVVGVDRASQFLIASSGSGIESFSQLKSASAQRSLRCGYLGTGSMLTVALIAHHLQLKHECIPYKSSDQIVQSLMANDIQIVAIGATAFAPLLAKGQARLLSALSAQRSASYPQVPTLMEQGVPFAIAAHNGLWAPPGLPARVGKKLSEAVLQVTQQAEFTTALKALAMEVNLVDAAGQLAALKAMNETYRRGAELSGFKPN